MKYIIALMGPSQSGKSFIIKKFLQNKTEGFEPELVAKQTTRLLRKEEQESLLKGEPIDVEHVEKVTADLVYQTYGNRTGVDIKRLIDKAEEGKVPIVVINDIMAMAKLKKECRRRCGDELCVISVFLFRRIPVREEYFTESNRRGNVSPKETEQRFDKAKTVYRIYIENMHMFDHVMLNTISYGEKELWESDTIVDKQIRSIRDNIILKNERPYERTRKDTPVLFVISGNGASGKDELIEATYAMGKLYADVVPKYTSRDQKRGDGEELICKRIITGEQDGKLIYSSNPRYEEFERDREANPGKYVSYWSNGNSYEYVVNTDFIREGFQNGRSMVIALSHIETMQVLKKEFPGQISAVYCCSQISKEEFERKYNDDVAKNKLQDFDKEIKKFVDNYMEYEHVIIYADSKLGHKSDGRQEELIDQLFRLFRAYEEQWI